MNIYDTQRARDVQTIIDSVSKSIELAVKCCPNCLHFDRVRETCDKADDKRPPANVIAFGCNAFNGIPPF